MTQTLVERHVVGTDTEFRQRVEIAMIGAATNVMAESAAAPGHALRAAYATHFLNNPSTASAAASMVIAAQPGIVGLAATDSDLQFTCTTIFNALAGYSAAP